MSIKSTKSSKNDRSAHFMEYQRRWFEDNSAVKIAEKSRQIGYTYGQAYEDVRDAVDGKWDTWFSSSDLGNAAEYIEYCRKWVYLYKAAAEYLGYNVVDDNRDIKAYRIEFANGRRITALSSSPKALRGKHGKVVLDEFAWHDNPMQMWRAAKPATTWGYPLRILSTHNGKNSLFNSFINDIRSGEKKHWSLHTVTIHDAVNAGIYDKIKNRPTSEAERKAWLKELQEDCFDYDSWLQEYCCIPVDESTAFLTYAMLEVIEQDRILKPLGEISGDLYVGVDIGRRRHLTVIWGAELLGSVLYTRFVIPLEKAAFKTQKDVLFPILNHPRLMRACIDDTGIGMQLAEEATEAFGKNRVEPVTFTSKAKEDLAWTLHTRAEDRQIYIPRDTEIREDLHSVRKSVTAAGNIRFDSGSTDKNGHADRFWAAALCCHAAKQDPGEIYVTGARKKSFLDLFRQREKIDYSNY